MRSYPQPEFSLAKLTISVSTSGDTGDLLERGATESLADLGKGGALGIRKAHTGWKVRPEDAIFCDQILILEQEFLIDQAGDVRQEPSQFVVWHEEDPS